MAGVDAALAKAAAEDGGVVFECRPRGWPPGWRLRVVLVLLLLSPLLVGWGNLLLSAVRLRDHDPTWSATWTQVTLRATDRAVPVTAHARGLLWGLGHPLVPGLEVPWLLLSVLAFGALEAVRLARYRSRRIALVSPGHVRRLSVSEGFLRPTVREHLLGPVPVRVVDGAAGVTVEREAHSPEPLGPIRIALGRLDPLDLADLARALDAPPPGPPAPRRRRWPKVVALAALLAAPVLVLVAAPWRATLTIRLPRGEDTDDLTFALDAPAWGPLRARVSLVDQPLIAPASVLSRHPMWLSAVDFDGRPVASLDPHSCDNGLLRRRETHGEWMTLGEPLSRPTTPLRVTGWIHLVEGPPLQFDVTILPGESLTLDLADLAAKAKGAR